MYFLLFIIHSCNLLFKNFYEWFIQYYLFFYHFKGNNFNFILIVIEDYFYIL